MTPIDNSRLTELCEEATRQYMVFEKTKVLLFVDVILELLNKEECVSLYSQQTASGVGRYSDYDKTCIFLEVMQNPNPTHSTLCIGILHDTKILDFPSTIKRVHKNRYLAQARKIIGTTLHIGTIFVYNSSNNTIVKL